MPCEKLISGFEAAALTAIGVTSNCGGAMSGGAISGSSGAVSYTHLTLPTRLMV